MKQAVLVASLAVLCLALPARAASQSTLLGSKPHGGGSSTLHSLERETGVGTQIGAFAPSVPGMNGLAYDAVHHILYGITADHDRLYRISSDTAEVTAVGESWHTAFDNANGLAYDPARHLLYATDNATNSLFTIDPNTGVASLVGGIGGGFSHVEGLGFNGRTGTLYGLADGLGGDDIPYYGQIIVIDPATGNAAALGNELPSDRIWRGLTFDAETDGLIASGDSGLYWIDPSTGAAHFIGGMYVQGLAVIPDPATLALLAAGGAAMALRSKRGSRAVRTGRAKT
jgi:DNA-binding beta-propeller fold protein YncE